MSLIIDIKEMCKICYEYDNQEKLITPCLCKGSVKFVHDSCVKEWIKFSGKRICTECNSEYDFIRKNKILKYLEGADFPILIFLWLFVFITIVDLELKFYFL